ncbi:MAG: DNA polymerase III subunit gamma/tau [Actinomycetia bacterium]|nr:DNA polymerase III subunit gamma/tau [Actinomycetes bacterium]
MSYISFYRKWRPQTFSEIIGQEYVVQTLENAIIKNRISHAYMFCGPRGTGKTSLARIFAKALNCVNGPTSKPCNKCDNCVSISNGNNMDVIEIDAASNRGINEIRELREKVKYLPAALRKKVYIIDEVHMLTTEAFNALLKVLEEPPEHVIFIMATTEPHQVLATIMSRCQRFDFYPIPQDKIRKRLKGISTSEDITINDSALNLIAKYADGSLRDADGILEQLSSLGENDITVDDVSSLLGVIDIEMLFEIANILIEKNLNQALLFIHRVISSSINLKIFVSEFLDHLYNLYVLRNYDSPLEILDIGEDFKERYFNQAKLFSTIEVEFLINLYSELLKQLRWSESAKSYFKAAIIKSVNYRFIDEEQMDKRFKKIGSDLEELKNDISKISVSIQESNIKPASIKKDEDIIEEKHADVTDAKDIEIKKITGSDDFEKAIKDNWNRIVAKLKEKNVPLHAKFIEVKNFKIDNNAICFYLAYDKKWHKENLNKINNASFIKDIIKEITGKNFKVVFEITDTDKVIQDTDKVIQGTDKVIDSKEHTIKNENEFADEISGKEKKWESDNKSNNTNDAESDIFDYIEEKFEIKEK